MVDKLFVATKAFIEFQGKVLLLKESGEYKDGTNVGRFDVPGGRIKPGEQFADSLRREVKEETGLEVNIGEPIFVNEWRPVVKGEQWQVVGIFFRCQAQTDQVILSEDHIAYEWIDPHQYNQYELIDNLKPAFTHYLQKL
jgi:8-oxo-dGTP diphosphatase